MWIYSESDPPSSASIDVIWGRLGETIDWCQARIDLDAPATCFRSPDLRPRVMQPSYAAGVRDAANNRQLALGRRASPRPDLAGGRILVYGPDEEMSDGAAEIESFGYLDINNCPPWDTWIALTEFADAKRGRAAHLFSWVPPGFVPLVQDGIDADPVDSISWLADWKAPAASELIDALRSAR